MTDWARVLRAVSPRAKSAVVSGLAPYLDDAFERYEINSSIRQAHFLAQAAHESAGFTTLQELGGPSYFKRYDNRADLGNTKPGDGNRFHGRGIFQLTGRANYRRFGKRIGVDLEANPELAAEGRASVELACLYWKDKKLNAKADRDDLEGITRAINGGTNGLADRKACLARAKSALPWVVPLGLISTEPHVEDEDRDAEQPDDGDPHGSGLDKDAIHQVQCRLRTLQYYDVGDADGELGDFTRTAVYAFKLQEHLSPLNSEIDDAFLRQLSIARPRPVSDARANATAQELAPKIPEVKASLSARLWSGIQAAGASVAALVAGARSYFSDTMDQLTPFRDALGRIPTWVWILLVAALSAFIWWRNNRAVNETTDAYQRGARK